MARSTLVPVLLALAMSQTSCGPDCTQLQADARALVTAYGRCKAGDECVVVTFGSLLTRSCTGAFSCAAAFKKGSDLAAFSSQAREIEDEYKNCNRCAQAECAVPPTTATCNVATGMCELR